MVVCVSVCLLQWARVSRRQQWEQHRQRHWSEWWVWVDCRDAGTSLVLLLLAVKQTPMTRLLWYLGQIFSLVSAADSSFSFASYSAVAHSISKQPSGTVLLWKESYLVCEKLTLPNCRSFVGNSDNSNYTLQQKEQHQEQQQQHIGCKRKLQELSSFWDGRPFGHNRHGPNSGGCCAPFWGSWVPINYSVAWLRPTSMPSFILIHPTI